MANAITAFNRTASDVFETISSATHSITHGTNSLAFLAETASIRAEAYRDDTLEEVKTNSGKRRILRVESARIEVSEDILKLRDRLQADPRLAEIYSSIDEDDFALIPAK